MLLRWRFAAWRDGLPPAPRTPTPRVAPDLAFLHANARAGQAMQPAVTWIGHASVPVQAGGLNVLIDRRSRTARRRCRSWDLGARSRRGLS